MGYAYQTATATARGGAGSRPPAAAARAIEGPMGLRVDAVMREWLVEQLDATG